MRPRWRPLSAAAAHGALFALVPCAAWSSGAGGVAFWCLALLGLLPADPPVRDDPRRAARLRLLMLAGAVPFLLNLASVLVFDLKARDLSLLPFLALPLVARGAEQARDPVRAFVDGALAACFVALGAALWSRLVLGEPQPAFMMNPLLFGNLALVAAVVAAWDIAAHPPGWRRGLSVLALLAGLAAFLSSGFRGGLLALPLLVAAFLHLGEPPARRRQVPWRTGLALALVAVVAAVALAPRKSVIERLPMVIDEVRGYAEGRIERSSVGSRLAMWQAAGTMVAEHPVFGVGVHRFQDALAELRDRGRFPADVNLYRHAHSSYVTLAAEYGLLGLAVMALALVAAVAALRRAEPDTRMLGLWLLGCWLVFALTNDVLSHQNLIRSCVAGIAVFAASRPSLRATWTRQAASRPAAGVLEAHSR